MRKSLTILMRLQREKKERRQRDLALAQRDVAQASDMLARARSEMANEEALVASSLAASVLAIANPHYLPRAQARIFELDSRLAHLRRKEEQCRAEVLASFRDEKTHEKLIERRQLEERKEREQAEQKESAQLSETAHHNKMVSGKRRY